MLRIAKISSIFNLFCSRDVVKSLYKAQYCSCKETLCIKKIPIPSYFLVKINFLFSIQNEELCLYKVGIFFSSLICP